VTNVLCFSLYFSVCIDCRLQLFGYDLTNEQKEHGVLIFLQALVIRLSGLQQLICILLWSLHCGN